MNIKNSPLTKIALIGLIAILLLIPSKMTEGLVGERQSRSQETEWNIQNDWSTNQQITGPVLSIPIHLSILVNGKYVLTKRRIRVLPSELDVKGTIDPEIRKRGIYKVPVYKSTLDFHFSFEEIEETLQAYSPDSILWNESTLNIGISDLSGIQSVVEVHAEDLHEEMNPGIENGFGPTSGLQLKVDPRGLEKDKNTMRIELKGSSSLSIVPVGKESTIQLESSWADPNFFGSFLPDEHNINEYGFVAHWKVLDLNRNFPQSWTENSFSISETSVGVELHSSADHYQKAMRAAKFGVVFIALSFAAFFLFEILKKKTIHPVQYLLVGASLIVFHSLLLAFSEHIGFNKAYLTSLALIILLNFIYLSSILQNRWLGALGAGLQVLMFGFLFVVLQLKDLALLAGALGLFATLSAIMILSRKVDWYGQQNEIKKGDH